MKNFEQICCGQPIEGMKGRPDGCIVDINDSGVSVCVLMNRPTPKEISQFEGGKGVKVKLLSLLYQCFMGRRTTNSAKEICCKSFGVVMGD